MNNNIQKLGWNNSTVDENYKIARIVAEHKNSFDVNDGADEFRANISGRFYHGLKYTNDMPIIGDWVLLRPDAPTIEQIIPRKTVLRRRAPDGRKDFEQAIAANVDIIFIVVSLNQNFNLSRIERALALVYTSGAMPVILLSKSDLCNDAVSKITNVEQIAFGVPVICFSNITGQNLDTIRDMILPRKTACLIGSSGVGKTTLTNALCGLNKKTIAVRQSDDRGRHATTSRALHVLSNGGMIIDTPGIREIGLTDDASGLESMYSDIKELALKCRFSDCTHTSEPGCAIRLAISAGALDERQYKNYVKMQKEIVWANNISDARRAKNEKQKQISKLLRNLNNVPK